MKKVCHLTSAHPWNDVRIFHKECKSLAKGDFEVSLIAFEAEAGVYEQVRVIDAGHKPAGRFNRMIAGTKAVFKAACELDADIYHLHDPELLIIGKKLIQRGKRVVYDAHEDLPLQIMAKHWIPKPFRKAISWATTLVIKHYLTKLSAVVAATPIIENKIKQWNTKTISVCNYPLLSEMPMLDNDNDSKTNNVCYIGGLFESRGLFQMLDAVADLPVKLELAGLFSPESLKERAMLHKSWKNVNYHGFVDRKEVYHIISKSKAGLVVLLPTLSYVESLPIKMFEYMSSGTPVICSDFPLWKEIIDANRCGICVDPLNPAAIAKAIQQLIEHPAAAKVMGENGKNAILTKYNWEVEETKLEKLYKQLS